MRYPPEIDTQPSIMLLRGLAYELGIKVEVTGGGYGAMKNERAALSAALKVRVDDGRLSEWDREMINNLV